MDPATDRDVAAVPATDQADRLAHALGCAVELEALGGASRTFRVTGTDHIVTVPLGWPAQPVVAADLVRRCTLLERIAGRVSLAVPRVVQVLPEQGLVVVRRLEGERLIDVSPALRASLRSEVAAALGTLLAELHTWDPQAWADVAAADDYIPEDWREETAQLVDALVPVLDAGQLDDVRRFLAQPAPAPVAVRVLSHNDLGIEHVLVSTSPGAPAVTGVIDWDDAASCDPAYDFGLLLRDLGPTALDSALAAYADAGGSCDGIAARAWFYARCTLLEDLAFGHAEHRPEYVAKGLAAWAETFGAHAGDGPVRPG